MRLGITLWDWYCFSMSNRKRTRVICLNNNNNNKKKSSLLLPQSSYTIMSLKSFCNHSEPLFCIRYLLNENTVILTKYKITFILIITNYWLCHHVKALEIITLDNLRNNIYVSINNNRISWENELSILSESCLFCIVYFTFLKFIPYLGADIFT